MAERFAPELMSTTSSGRSGMTNLLLEYDESVDAAYLTVSDEPWDRQERLDDVREINYAANGAVIGIEILSPRRKGGCSRRSAAPR